MGLLGSRATRRDERLSLKESASATGTDALVKRVSRPEMAELDEPATLKEKVARDFDNPALVKESDAFMVSGATFAALGGLRYGEHFVDEKVKLIRTSLPAQVDEDVNIFS